MEITSALSNLPSHIPLKWCLLGLPLIGVIFWHRFQHRYYREFLEQPNRHAYHELFATTRWRSILLIVVWCIALIAVAVGDMRRFAPEQQEIAESAPLSTSEIAGTITDEGLQPLNFPEQTAEPQPSPEEMLDNLKSQYEDAYVSYMFMERCHRATIEDLTLINNSLAREAERIGGDKSLVYSIFTAAQGTYESIYVDASCDPAYLASAEKQFRQFLTQLRAATP